MTIEDAIKLLEALSRAHGKSTLVYFDCPKCNISFTPTTVTPSAVHISGEKK